MSGRAGEDMAAVVGQTHGPVTLAGRPAPVEERVSPYLWPSVLTVACVLVLLTVAGRAWRRRTRRPGRRALLLMSKSAGLSRAQRRLVERIGGAEPAAILVSEQAFRTAVARWGSGERTSVQTEELAAVARALGWETPRPAEKTPVNDRLSRVA